MLPPFETPSSMAPQDEGAYRTNASKQKIPRRQRQHFRRRADEQLTVRSDRICLGIDANVRRRIVMDERLLANPAAHILDGHELLLHAKFVAQAALRCRLRYEGDAGIGARFAVGAEHRPVMHGLWCRN